MKRISLSIVVVFSLVIFSSFAMADGIDFQEKPGQVEILLGEQRLARFVYQDSNIFRPYFCDIHTLGGTQVTRNHPPIEGQDRADHADMHPGIWTAFGDIGGYDFWRNKARVKTKKFLQKPDNGFHGFSLENEYLGKDDSVICTEQCTIRFVLNSNDNPQYYCIEYQSVFSPGDERVYFGDQEEMGLGIRVATPMTVNEGGTIRNSHGGVNEKGVWGKTAEWCAYQGSMDGNTVGMMIVPDPKNFRPSWFHVRDYGLMVANPFGRKAMTGGEESKVWIEPGESLRLRFMIAVYQDIDAESDALNRLGKDALNVLKAQ